MLCLVSESLAISGVRDGRRNADRKNRCDFGSLSLESSLVYMFLLLFPIWYTPNLRFDLLRQLVSLRAEHTFGVYFYPSDKTDPQHVRSGALTGGFGQPLLLSLSRFFLSLDTHPSTTSGDIYRERESWQKEGERNIDRERESQRFRKGLAGGVGDQQRPKHGKIVPQRPSESCFWEGHKREILGASKGINTRNGRGGGEKRTEVRVGNWFLWGSLLLEVSAPSAFMSSVSGTGQGEPPRNLLSPHCHERCPHLFYERHSYSLPEFFWLTVITGLHHQASVTKPFFDKLYKQIAKVQPSIRGPQNVHLPPSLEMPAVLSSFFRQFGQFDVK